MMSSLSSQQRFSAKNNCVMQQATIGVVKEIMPSENRVAVTPIVVKEYTQNGHQVYVQTGAGDAAGFKDQMYVQAGATMIQTPQETYKKSQIMMKVMQPMVEEYDYIQQNQIIFCFFDSQNGTEFIQNMMQHNVVIFNYEFISGVNTFPIMAALSGVAGYTAVQQGMKYMEAQMGGSGKLMGQVAGVEAARVLILGGGVAAFHAAMFASNIGAQVTIMNVSLENIRQMQYMLPANVNIMLYTTESLEKQLPYTDLLIGAVMCHDFHPALLVSAEQMKLMQPKTVVIDLAMEYGGNFETSQMTWWENPIMEWNNITHFCARNITCCVPYTASQALAYSALPYALQVANMSWKHAAVENTGLLQGICVANKNFTNEKLASFFNIAFTPIEMVLEEDIKKAAEKGGKALMLKNQLHMLNANGNKSKIFMIEA